MNTTKKLLTLLLAMIWLLPLDALAANKPGDVNNDGVVDVADLTAVIDILMGFSGSTQNADVNYDGEIDISDVITVIDIILGYPAPTPPWVETFTVNGVSFNMVKVEGGTFMMGATPEQSSEASNNERPAHQVTLSSYCIGETEVTQELFKAVMGYNSSWYVGDMNRPVEGVRWNDCQMFIILLNELTGKTFRLPTEAEWEFAARGGNKSQGYKYAGSNDIDEVAWYWDNAYGVGSSSPDYGTHVVGTKAPNELGLYDMSGNVYEWVQDWFDNYSSEAQTNPTGPASGTQRVYRGGGFSFIGMYCCVSHRRRGEASSTMGSSLGFRLALTPDAEEEGK